MAEHLDHLHYLNDILCLRIDNLNEVLTLHLLNRLFIPLYIYSLVRNPVASSSLEVKYIVNDELVTRNPGFGFWKCHGEMDLRQVEQGFSSCFRHI